MLIDRISFCSGSTSDFKNQGNALLVVNSRRQIVGMTPSLLKIWHLPEIIVRSQSDELALQVVSNQFDNPQKFLKNMTEIYANLELEIHETVLLRDGRMIERHSQPLWVKGIYVGRMWAFAVNQ